MREERVFHSWMSPAQRVLAILYLPFHVFILPQLLVFLAADRFSDSQLNLLVYLIGFTVLVTAEISFLRRDFDPLCDHLLQILLEVCVCYGLVLAFNILANALLMLLASLLGEAEMETLSPNNQTIMELLGEDRGGMTALALFLAPITEELMFRGGIFGALRRVNRVLAYVVSALLFSLYHVWGYALTDPLAWLYLLQYLPVSLLLCRCYERSDSIWGSILLHATINFLSLQAIAMLEELL